MFSLLKRMAVFVLVGLVASCTSPTALCGCSPVPPSTLLVKGLVRNANQTPAPGLIVRVTAFEHTCNSASPLNDYGVRVSQTDAQGRFRIDLLPVVSGGVALDSACVRVSAFAAPETSAELGSTVKMGVRIPGPGQPKDSSEFLVVIGTRQ